MVSGEIKEGVEWSERGYKMAPTENLIIEDSSSIMSFVLHPLKTYPHLPNIITIDKSYLILREIYPKRKK